MDPWSRRQQPFKVPRLRWHQRYPRTVVLLITFGGSGLLFSRFIYDAFLKRFFEDEPSNLPYHSFYVVGLKLYRGISELIVFTQRVVFPTFHGVLRTTQKWDCGDQKFTE